MIIHFSIVKKGGLEIYSLDNKTPFDHLVKPDMLSGFLTAIQLYSETMRTILKQIQFDDFTLYFKSYGDFSFRLMVLEKLDIDIFENFCNKLSKELFLIFSNSTEDNLPEKSEIERIINPILSSFYLAKPETTEILTEEIKLATISKIVLVGLAKAGKTSIKRIFFEKWSREMVRNIKPTTGIEITLKLLNFLDHRIAIHDFGGQITYRKDYIQRHDIWNGISTLIFVVDIQNPSSFDVAKDYLSNIWEVVKRENNILPRLFLFLHKYDLSKREDLSENMRFFFQFFEEFTNIATFYLTTIEDSSSNIALIKSLYFSIPEVILKRLLEEELLDYFETQILPRYSTYLQDNGEFMENFHLSKPQILENVQIHGMSIGFLLQKSWMDALMGDWNPKQRLLSKKALTIKKKDKSLLITIPNWTDEDIPKELTNTLLDGILIGVLKTFQLPGPIRISETDYITTWEVGF